MTEPVDIAGADRRRRYSSPLDARLLVLTGKGGVGKSTLAVAAARAAALRGRRVLLCDMDASGTPARLLGSDVDGYAPVEVESMGATLSVMQMRTDAALFDYLATFTPFSSIARVGPLSRGLALMGEGAPGLREVLAIGKLLWTIRRDEYDLVVMDGPATGHVVAHLDAPASVGALAVGGLLGSQTSWMRDMLVDVEVTGVVPVAVPEEGPVTEARLLVEQLASLGIAAAGAVMNRMPPPPGLRRDLELVRELRATDAVWSQPMSSLLERRAATAATHEAAATASRAFEDAVAAVPVLAVPDLRADPTSIVEAVTSAVEEEW